MRNTTETVERNPEARVEVENPKCLAAKPNIGGGDSRLMKSPLHFVALLVFPAFCLALEPISRDGECLGKAFDEMRVEEHWPAGVIVDWRTGDPTGKPVTDKGRHTHCSQFAASACERLGIYLLRPPEHSPVLLANAQFDWLKAKGSEAGWEPVPDGVAAQDLANRGNVVVAVYKNQNPKKSGHIAIVRPGIRTPAEIAEEGPEVIQAGGHNYNRVSLKRGFVHHPAGFARGEIQFYSHAVPSFANCNQSPEVQGIIDAMCAFMTEKVPLRMRHCLRARFCSSKLHSSQESHTKEVQLELCGS